MFMTTTYKIVRMFQNSDISNRVIRRGLTLDEAQEHCRNPETSSATAKSAKARKYTERHGRWFDGFQVEK